MRGCWILLFVTVLVKCAAGEYAYIAFVGDVHNRIEEQKYDTWQYCRGRPGECVGGWARIAAQAKLWRERARNESAAFFLLDAGDEFNGTDWDKVYRGNVTARIQNLGGVNVMQLGNHEFDYGLPALREYIQAARFPVLGACNIDASNEPLLAGLLKKWIVLEYVTPWKTKYKIGVVGWITQTTKDYLDSRGKSYGKLRFLPDDAPTIQACVNELLTANPDVNYVIGLSHAGLRMGARRGDVAIANSTKGLNLIIGGHTHTFMYKTDIPQAPLPFVRTSSTVNSSNCAASKACDVPQETYPFPSRSSPVPVVHSYFSSKYMGILRVKLTEKRLSSAACASCNWGPAQPVLLGGNSSTNPVTPDPDMARLIDSLKGPVRAIQRKAARLAKQSVTAAAAAVEANQGFVEDDFVFGAAVEGEQP